MTKAERRGLRALRMVRDYHRRLAKGWSPADAIFAIKRRHGVPSQTLYRWISKVRGKPEQSWLSLLTPNWIGRTELAELSSEAWGALLADYLRPERPGMAECIRRLRLAAAGHGWVIPSNRTLQRRLEKASASRPQRRKPTRRR